MTRSNSAAARNHHIAKAKSLYEDGIADHHRGEEAAAIHYRRRDNKHRMAADEILKAKEVDPAYPNTAIAKAMGIDRKTVERLLEWRRSGADRPSPYAGQSPARSMRSFRQVVREGDAAEIAATMRGRPDVIDEAIAFEDEPDDAPIPPEMMLQTRDVVSVGKDVLLVGDATSVQAKIVALLGGAVDMSFPEFHLSSEVNAAIVTDQPYGLSKKGVPGDDRANYGAVYKLLNARGGFVFCAFNPPHLFREAERGIIEAGGIPIANYALSKGGGHWIGPGCVPPGKPEGPPRVLNRLDALVYFEMPGRGPWIKGRTALPALITPALTLEARVERKRLGGEHPTPKYIDVLMALISRVSEPDDLILDPFTGSGTTWVAAIRSKRRFVGIELKPAYAARAVLNAQRERGIQAIVVPDDAAPFRFGEPRPDATEGYWREALHRCWESAPQMEIETIQSYLTSQLEPGEVPTAEEIRNILTSKQGG